MEFDRGIGYDDNDSFIDNTEAVSNLFFFLFARDFTGYMLINFVFINQSRLI